MAFISRSTKVNGPVLDQSGISASSQQTPTAIRWRIMALVAIVNTLPSLGRISLGVAAKPLQEEFHFETTTMGWILSAFWLSYGLFQLPGGWMGDRYGPRKVLTIAIVWYSLFMAAMAIVPRFAFSRSVSVMWSFALVQFLIGAGEACTSPNSAKVVASWMNKNKLGFGVSFTTFGIGVGGCITPIFIVWTMERWGWRTSFWLCGLIGIVVALVWAKYVSNRPDDHRGINAAELALIRAGKRIDALPPSTNHPMNVPWRRILVSRSAWALLISYACRAYPMYFFNTWFFIYLVKVRGLTVVRGGLLSATPFLAVLLFSPVGGWFSDAAVQRLGKRRGRQVAVWLGMASSAALVWIGSHVPNNLLAILLVASGAGFNMAANVTWWVACIDLAPEHAGSLSGLMNMCGGVGGWLAPILTGYIATKFGWERALDVIAVLSIVSGLLWLVVNVDAKLDLRPSQLPRAGAPLNGTDSGSLMVSSLQES